MKHVVSTENAPKAIGPYSQGVRAGNFIFTAGQVGIDPAVGKLTEGGIEAQTRQALKNVSAILETEGISLTDVVKTTVFLADMNDFQAMNGVYATFFSTSPPARSTVQVARLPLGALVEIEVVALIDE